MSFHKRYITKELILSNINDLDRIFSADAFIMDMWSSRFCEDLNKDERLLRNSIKKRLKFSSSLCPQCEPEFKQLSSMAECLISLMTHPNWLDVILVQERIGLSLKIEGNFEIAYKDAIERIIDHYDKPNRNDKIEEILR